MVDTTGLGHPAAGGGLLTSQFSVARRAFPPQRSAKIGFESQPSIPLHLTENHKMVDTTGLEPVTSSMSRKRSNQLSYVSCPTTWCREGGSNPRGLAAEGF